MIAADRLLLIRGNPKAIWSMSHSGGPQSPVLADAAHDLAWPRRTKTRDKFLFYKCPPGTAGSDAQYSQNELWVSDAVSTRKLLDVHAYGWSMHGHAEWNPDGTKLVMFALDGTGAHIVTTDANGQNRRNVYSAPDHKITDPSWSGDGQTIVFCQDDQVMTVRANGTHAKRMPLTGWPAFDPYFMADGKIVALVRYSIDPFPGAWGAALYDPAGSVTYHLNDGTVWARPVPFEDRVVCHRYDRAHPDLGWQIVTVKLNDPASMATLGPGEFPAS